MKKNKTSRYFSIVTYLTVYQVKLVLDNHKQSIRAFMYIEHDQDEAEPHIHLLLRTYSCWTAEQLCKWFSFFVDEEGKKINTFCEVATSIESLVPYILHDTDEARAEGKHLYSADSLVKGNERSLLPRKDCYDDTYSILNDMLLGVPLRQMVRRYGRDFVYHYSQYSALCDSIWQDEGITGARRNAELDNLDEIDTSDELPF